MSIYTLAAIFFAGDLFLLAMWVLEIQSRRRCERNYLALVDKIRTKIGVRAK